MYMFGERERERQILSKQKHHTSKHAYVQMVCANLKIHKQTRVATTVLTQVATYFHCLTPYNTNTKHTVTLIMGAHDRVNRMQNGLAVKHTNTSDIKEHQHFSHSHHSMYYM